MNNHFEKKYLYYTDSVQVYVAWEELTGVKVLKVSYFYKYQKIKYDFSPCGGSFISYLDTWRGFKCLCA